MGFGGWGLVLNVDRGALEGRQLESNQEEANNCYWASGAPPHKIVTVKDSSHFCLSESELHSYPWRFP